jgi:hypothetical protein
MCSVMNAQTRPLIIVVLLLAVVLATAWGLDVVQGSKAADDYNVRLVRDDAVFAVFSLEDLRAMESRRVRMQGQLQEGPSLLEVLRQAGVEEFDSVVVRGMALRDAGVIELERDEVDEDVLLDFAIRGTVKLCGPEIGWANRVRDVEEIEVR